MACIGLKICVGKNLIVCNTQVIIKQYGNYFQVREPLDIKQYR